MQSRGQEQNFLNCVRKPLSKVGFAFKSQETGKESSF